MDQGGPKIRKRKGPTNQGPNNPDQIKQGPETQGPEVQGTASQGTDTSKRSVKRPSPTVSDPDHTQKTADTFGSQKAEVSAHGTS